MAKRNPTSRTAAAVRTAAAAVLKDPKASREPKSAGASALVHPSLSTRERRERGLNDLAAVIEELYGPRCSRNEGGCTTCAVWAVFDALGTMTDASLFGEEIDKDASA